MSVKAIIFDVFGVIYQHGVDQEMLQLARKMSKDHEVALFTSGSNEMLNKLLNTKQQAVFNKIFTNDSFGPSKPDADAYRIISQKLGLQPQECLIIDDSTKNIEGAKQAGMKTIHFESNDQFKSDLPRLLE